MRTIAVTCTSTLPCVPSAAGAITATSSPTFAPMSLASCAPKARECPLRERGGDVFGEQSIEAALVRRDHADNLSARGSVAGREQAEAVDPWRGVTHGGMLADPRDGGLPVGARGTADRVVDAAIREVRPVVHLKVPDHQFRAVPQQLQDDAAGKAEQDDQEGEGERHARHGDQAAPGVAPEIAPPEANDHHEPRSELSENSFGGMATSKSSER